MILYQINIHMSLNFDAETAKKLNKLYESQDAKKRRNIVLRALNPQPGEKILDIGTGLGHLALEMAEKTGKDSSIIGIDLNEPMLELARQKCENKSWIEFQNGNASSLPFSDNFFDAAVSIQVYEYLKDPNEAICEMQRVLKPGGRGVIVATDWKSTLWHSSKPERMKKVLTAWEKHCAYSDLPRKLSQILNSSRLIIQSQDVISQFNTSLNIDAYSFHILDFIKSFVIGKNGVTHEEAEAWVSDLYQLDKKGEYFFCLNQFLFLVGK